MTVEQIIYTALTTALTGVDVFHIAAPQGAKMPFLRFADVLTGVEYHKGVYGLEPGCDHHELTIDIVAKATLQAAQIRDAVRNAIECKEFAAGGLAIDGIELSRADIDWNDDCQGWDAQLVFAYDSQVDESYTEDTDDGDDDGDDGGDDSGGAIEAPDDNIWGS